MKYKLYNLKSFVGGVDSDEEMDEDMELSDKTKLLIEYNYTKLIKA
jgi:hypothetical protein